MTGRNSTVAAIDDVQSKTQYAAQYLASVSTTISQLEAVATCKSRAVAKKPRDAVAVLFGLQFVDTIHYKFMSSQASKACHLCKQTLQ